MSTMTAVPGNNFSPIIIAKQLLTEAPTVEQLRDELSLLALSAGNSHTAPTNKPIMPPHAGFELRNHELRLTSDVAGVRQIELNQKLRILARYPDAKIFDPAVLGTMLDRDGFPRLTVFAAGKEDLGAQFKIQVHAFWVIAEKQNGSASARTPVNTELQIDHNLPTTVTTNATQPFIKRLANEAWNQNAQACSGLLPGQHYINTEVCALGHFGPHTIPEVSKRIIQGAKESLLFDEVYLIAEVNNWELKRNTEAIAIRAQQNLDPIVIGEKNGECWAIHCFDLTPSERYAVDEFALKPLN